MGEPNKSQTLRLPRDEKDGRPAIQKHSKVGPPAQHTHVPKNGSEGKNQTNETQDNAESAAYECKDSIRTAAVQPVHSKEQ
jgi:hypothetical protein